MEQSNAPKHRIQRVLEETNQAYVDVTNEIETSKKRLKAVEKDYDMIEKELAKAQTLVQNYKKDKKESQEEQKQLKAKIHDHQKSQRRLSMALKHLAASEEELESKPKQPQKKSKKKENGKNATEGK